MCIRDRCRHVINQEKAEETERLRKLKRKKNAYTTIRAHGTSVTPSDWGNDADEWDDLESTLLMSSMTQENMLERQWVVNSNDDQKSASGSPVANPQQPPTGSPEQQRPGTAGNSNIYARAPPGHQSRLNPTAPLAGRAVGGGRFDQGSRGRGGRFDHVRGRGRF